MTSISPRISETYVYFRPVVPLLFSMISGIAAGSQFSGHGVCACLIAFVFLCLILYCLYKNRNVIFIPIVLFFALGYLSIQSWMAPKFPPHHIIHFENAHSWKIAGVIDTPVATYSNRQKFILRTETLEGNNTSFPVTGRIRLTVSGNGPKLLMGDRIVFFGRIKSIIWEKFHQCFTIKSQIFRHVEIIMIIGNNLKILHKIRKRIDSIEFIFGTISWCYF